MLSPPNFLGTLSVSEFTGGSREQTVDRVRPSGFPGLFSQPREVSVPIQGRSTHLVIFGDGCSVVQTSSSPVLGEAETGREPRQGSYPSGAQNPKAAHTHRQNRAGRSALAQGETRSGAAARRQHLTQPGEHRRCKGEGTGYACAGMPPVTPTLHSVPGPAEL